MSEDRNNPSGSGGSAKSRPKGLGRGLGALLGEARREEPLVASLASAQGEQTAGSAGSGLAMIAVAAIEANPDQPRRHFNEAALGELAASIAQRGVIQPVVLRPLAANRYQLIAGERRWRAAQKARLHEIPAIVRDLPEREVKAIALIENLQREDLNPIEEARAYQGLTEEEGMTQAEVAELVDKSRSHVTNLMRLLSLPDEVISMVERGDLSMGHARALIGHDDAAALAAMAIAKKLSVREVEKLARAGLGGAKASPKPAPRRDSADDADIVAVQRHLEEILGLPVKISADADPRSGAVTVRYATLDQLDLICQRLTGGSI